jgi:hypothetical protein
MEGVGAVETIDLVVTRPDPYLIGRVGAVYAVVSGDARARIAATMITAASAIVPT